MNKKITLFVSLEGNDSFSGRYPDEVGGEGPYKTIHRAINEIKSLPEGYDVDIMLRDGVHYIHSELVLNLENCLGHKITIRNCCGEKPVISSGYKLNEWQKTSQYPKGVPQPAYGEIFEHCVPLINGRTQEVKTLFQGKNWLKRSSSKGFIPEDNSDLPRRFYELKIPVDIVSDFSLLKNAEVKIRPSYQWSMNYLEVESWNEEQGIIITKSSASYHMEKCHNFIDNVTESVWIENSPEFLDKTGSWYYDKCNQKIYLWPENGLENIFMPTLTEFLKVDGDEENTGQCIKDISIEGITFTCGERFTINDTVPTTQHEWECCDSPNAILRLRDAHKCIVRNCVFEYSSNTAVRLDLNCQNNVVENNTIRYVGGTGILLCGYGPGLRNVNRFNTVTGNHIYNCGEIYWQSMGIFVWHGSENTVSHNLIHDTGYIGIVVSGSRTIIFQRDRGNPAQGACVRELLHACREDIGSTSKWENVFDKSKYANDTEWFIKIVTEMSAYQHVENNIIEKNDIYRCVQRMSDANGIYLSDTCPGNIVRDNYIHDMNGNGGQQAIRTDEFLMGTMIEGNVVFRCNGGGINLKHLNNHARNNIIVDIRTVHDKELNGADAQMFFGYFSLVCVLDSENVPERKKISIEDNVVVLCDTRQTFFRVGNNDGGLLEDQIDKGKLDQCILKNNLYFATERQNEYNSFVEKLNKNGLDKGCVFADPKITIKNKNLMVEPDSQIHKMHIKIPDIQDVGI